MRKPHQQLWDTLTIKSLWSPEKILLSVNLNNRTAIPKSAFWTGAFEFRLKQVMWGICIKFLHSNTQRRPYLSLVSLFFSSHFNHFPKTDSNVKSLQPQPYLSRPAEFGITFCLPLPHIGSLQINNFLIFSETENPSYGKQCWYQLWLMLSYKKKICDTSKCKSLWGRYGLWRKFWHV